MAMRDLYCKDCKIKLTTDNENAATYPYYVQELRGFFGRVWQCRTCWRKTQYENTNKQKKSGEPGDTEVTGKGYEGV